MKKFEHTITLTDFTPDKFEEMNSTINVFGARGFELIAVIPIALNTKFGPPVPRLMCFFKKEYTQAQKQDELKITRLTDVYYCTICHKNEVDAKSGFDTCPECLSKQ